MKFCCQCGSEVELTIPSGDNRPRFVCRQCDFIHYQNPKIVAGCLVTQDDKVLLCKRGIEPRHGFWTLPAGFMENGESTRQAAQRETLEEACAEVSIDGLYTLTSITPIDQIQMIYRATLTKPYYAAGDETLQCGFFSEAEIPWQQLAFETIHNALNFYFEDRKTGDFPLRHIDLHHKKPVR
ncbi:MAG: NUDIX hydrolase [Motiliproteus sp.]|nr:NUDIX hydrolase [Motiliproteus sp.]MCW9052415.1 NUDIX hydrolase [Motiliproteus sp.]